KSGGGALSRGGGRAPREARRRGEGEAGADSRRTLRRDALPARRARRDARRVLRAARLGRRRRADRRSPRDARPAELSGEFPVVPRLTLRTIQRLAASIWILALIAAGAAADPVTVRFPDGTTHGFLVLRSLKGQTLAHGELLAFPHGDRMESRL